MNKAIVADARFFRNSKAKVSDYTSEIQYIQNLSEMQTLKFLGKRNLQIHKRFPMFWHVRIPRISDFRPGAQISPLLDDNPER